MLLQYPQRLPASSLKLALAITLPFISFYYFYYLKVYSSFSNLFLFYPMAFLPSFVASVFFIVFFLFYFLSFSSISALLQLDIKSENSIKRVGYRVIKEQLSLQVHILYDLSRFVSRGRLALRNLSDDLGDIRHFRCA